MAPAGNGKTPRTIRGSFRVPGIRHWLGKRGKIGQKALALREFESARQRPSGGSMTGQFNMRPEFLRGCVNELP